MPRMIMENERGPWQDAARHLIFGAGPYIAGGGADTPPNWRQKAADRAREDPLVKEKFLESRQKF